MTKIGFIGVGQLGEPMVRRLLDAGHQVTVFVRNEPVRERVRLRGAALAPTVADLASGSDILISCLFSDAQLRETGVGPEGFIANANPGSIFVSHTTGNAATLAELAAGAKLPPAIVDAPVSGTADDIARGRLTVLAGGESSAVAAVRPVLAAYADTIVETGGPGTALGIKLLNNFLFAANVQLVAAALELCTAFHVEPTKLLAALAVCSGGSKAAAYLSGAGGVDDFAAGIGPFLRKDVAAATLAAEAAGVDLGLLATTVHSGPLALS